MKWFFTYSPGVLSPLYDVHIRAAVRSAIANTSLDPHLIYCGRPDDPMLSFVESQGVRVIHHRPNILADLHRIKAKFPDYPLDIATGAFLRMDLPLICGELGYDDQFVFYTDCDVVFLRDIPHEPTQAFLRPALFAGAPEWFPSDWADLNTGVMVMNTVSLLEDYPAFRRFITSGDTLYYDLWKQGPFDQKAYEIHYASRWDRLPNEYNWKPYWGINDEALIIHWHGPKIPSVRALVKGEDINIPQNLRGRFNTDPGAYRHYLTCVEQYTSD